MYPHLRPLFGGFSQKRAGFTLSETAPSGEQGVHTEGSHFKKETKVALLNKSEIKSGLKTAFWCAFGIAVFVAPVTYVVNLVRARLPGATA